ncbi:MAG: hypothetical protein QW611_03980 [Ignisphaera sp.]
MNKTIKLLLISITLLILTTNIPNTYSYLSYMDYYRGYSPESIITLRWYSTREQYIFDGDVKIEYDNEVISPYLINGSMEWRYRLEIQPNTDIYYAGLFLMISDPRSVYPDAPNIPPEIYFSFSSNIYGYIWYNNASIKITCGSVTQTFGIPTNTESIEVVIIYFENGGDEVRIFYYPSGYNYFYCDGLTNIFMYGGVIHPVIKARNTIIDYIHIRIEPADDGMDRFRLIPIYGKQYFLFKEDMYRDWIVSGDIYLHNLIHELKNNISHSFDYFYIDFWFEPWLYSYDTINILRFGSSGGTAKWRYRAEFRKDVSRGYGDIFVNILFIDPNIIFTPYIYVYLYSGVLSCGGEEEAWFCRYMRGEDSYGLVKLRDDLYVSVHYGEGIVTAVCGSNTYTVEFDPYGYEFVNVFVSFFDRSGVSNVSIYIVGINPYRYYRVNGIRYYEEWYRYPVDVYRYSFSCSRFGSIVDTGSSISFEITGKRIAIGAIDVSSNYYGSVRIIDPTQTTPTTTPTATRTSPTTSIAFPFTPIDVVFLYRGRVFNESINVTDIIPPGGRLFAPGIVSPISLISFGMLFALFLYLSTRMRWTQALFIVSILLSVMSFVVFMEPALFVMGILLSLVSLVLDKYL